MADDWLTHSHCFDCTAQWFESFFIVCLGMENGKPYWSKGPHSENVAASWTASISGSYSIAWQYLHHVSPKGQTRRLRKMSFRSLKQKISKYQISPKISHPWISRKKNLTTVLSFKTLPKKILSMQGNKWPKRWGTRWSHHVRLFSRWCGVFPLTIQCEFCSSGCSREQIGWNSGDSSVFTKIWRQHLAATLLAHLTSCKRKLPPKLHTLKNNHFQTPIFLKLSLFHCKYPMIC